MLIGVFILTLQAVDTHSVDSGDGSSLAFGCWVRHEIFVKRKLVICRDYFNVEFVNSQDLRDRGDKMYSAKRHLLEAELSAFSIAVVGIETGKQVVTVNQWFTIAGDRHRFCLHARIKEVGK